MKYLKIVFLACISTTMLTCPIWGQHTTAGIDIEAPKSTELNGVQLSLALDRQDWLYKLGEQPRFTVKLLVNNIAMDSAEIAYSIGPEKMEAMQRGKVKVTKGYAELGGETMAKPGFLRCDVQINIEGKIYKSTATAAFEPENINPTTETPLDFDSYWAHASEIAKSVPLNTKLTLISSSGNDNVIVYQAEYEFYNDGIKKFYGVLSMPKKKGKYPAIIRFPGAGWLPSKGDQKNAAEGFITLDLYIHGHPVTYDRAYYVNLQENELKAYQYRGVESRDSFYFKNVILGCIRSVDLIHSLPEFNGKGIGAYGSSQGGALSIITSALDNRINYLVALCPAMCDFTGYSNNRAGGWPHFFTKPNLYTSNKRQVEKTLAYYDVVNFAKRLKIPGFFSWGFNDSVTPPTSMYAAYNVIESQKELYIILTGVHKIYPEQSTKTYNWLLKKVSSLGK